MNHWRNTDYGLVIMMTPEWYERFNELTCVLACPKPRYKASMFCKNHHERRYDKK